MNIAIIIPARYASTRFPGKPLAKIGGQSMLSRVVDLAKQAANGADNISVTVTTEDQRIADHAADIGADCIITSDTCETGSDRVLEAAQKLETTPDFILNIQGDAPFTPLGVVQKMLDGFADGVQVITPVHRLSWSDLDRLRENKVVTPFSGTTAIIGEDSQAMWFSKNIIPAIRKEDTLRAESGISPVHQHIGLYGYSFAALEKFCALSPSPHEQLEGLEQLRFLENDISITAIPVDIESGTLQSGIDTPEDLARAEEMLATPQLEKS